MKPIKEGVTYGDGLNRYRKVLKVEGNTVTYLPVVSAANIPIDGAKTSKLDTFARWAKEASHESD